MGESWQISNSPEHVCLRWAPVRAPASGMFVNHKHLNAGRARSAMIPFVPSQLLGWLGSDLCGMTFPFRDLCVCVCVAVGEAKSAQQTEHIPRRRLVPLLDLQR